MAVSRAFLCLIVGVTGHLHTALQQGQLQHDFLALVEQEKTEFWSNFDATWAAVRNNIKYLTPVSSPVSTKLLETFSKVEQQPEPGQPESGTSAWLVDIFGVLLQTVFICAFAHVYTKYRCVPEGKYEDSAAKECDGKWKHHCGSCFEEPITAFCGCCCLPVRWAETISLVKGLEDFWPALLCFTIIWAMEYTTTFALAGWLAIGCVGASYRQELRKRFQFESQGGASYVTDCLMYLIFPCCAVVQEARHVDDALARKHEQTECPKNRPRSISRRDCLTQRPCTSDGLEYLQN